MVPETVKGGTESSKASQLLSCSSKSLLNLRVSSSRFPINLLPIKELCNYSEVLFS